MKEAWGLSAAYERFVGRWSRMAAREFLAWLDVPSGQRWGDVGCGIGALTANILTLSEPQAIFAIDRSQGFLATARAAIPDQRVRFAAVTTNLFDVLRVRPALGRTFVADDGVPLRDAPAIPDGEACERLAAVGDLWVDSEFAAGKDEPALRPV